MLDLPHPILSDPDNRVAAAYGVLGGGRAAVARWTFYIGLDGRILFIDRSVTADGHGEEVPARLKQLGFAPRATRWAPRAPRTDAARPLSLPAV